MRGAVPKIVKVDGDGVVTVYNHKKWKIEGIDKLYNEIKGVRLFPITDAKLIGTSNWILRNQIDKGLLKAYTAEGNPRTSRDNNRPVYINHYEWLEL